ncbi:MAG: penicillin acylase family protein [Anaerolineae bacterium]
MGLFSRFAKGSLPHVEGTLTARGLRAPVEVIRDRWGVPHIYAQSIEDALFAQGFVHAQDRLWQMDVNRRAGQGRLSEIFGKVTLDLDRFARTVGLARAAQAELDAADPDSLTLLDAFVAGVNAWIARGQRPVEHRLLRIRVEPWTRLDSASWGILLVWGLSWNWESELERLALWRRLGPDRAAAMESEYPDSQATIFAEASGIEDVCAHLLDAYRRLSAWLPSSGNGVGSNNWVLAATRTATGRPMLANDPHLRLTLPSIWYENHLVVAEAAPYEASPWDMPPDRRAWEPGLLERLHVTGITLPGMPGVILGHNEHIAWGATATIADTQDLYLERFDPNDLSRYQTPAGWEQAQTIRESIRVRFRRESVEHVVRITRHGPIITGILDNAMHPERSAAKSKDASPFHIALKWTAHQPGDWLRSILALDRAADWASFKAALRGWHAPVINMAYADVDGRCALRVTGRIPVRKRGHGLMPVAGWNDDHEWIGEIPFDELPEMIGARSGDRSQHHTFVTANNRVVGPGYPYFISHEWLNGHRATRIRQLLDAHERVSIEGSLSIQMDVCSLDAAEIMERLLALDAHGDREASALERLRAWDGALTVDSVAASIYQVTQIELVRLLFADRLGPAFDGYLGGGQTALFVNVAFSNIALRQAREVLRRFAPQRDNLLRDALIAALDKLTARFGSNMDTWRWGRLHQIEPAHALSQVEFLRRFFNRGSFPIGGDGDTPQQANFRPMWPIEPVSVAPSYRVVYDVGEWDRSVSVLPGGQSGHPASAHYFDQFPLWLAGKARPMLWSRAAVEREAEARLWLRPI